MAPPMALAAGGMVASVIGGIVKYGAAGQEAEATANMYRYKAAVAEQNRRYQLQAGEIAQERSGMKTASEIGQATAIQGASNLDVGSGSAVKVRQSMKDIGIQEQGIIRSDAARRAYGEEAEEGLDISAAKQAKITGQYKQLSILTDTASSVSDKWFSGYRSGMFS